MNLIALNTASAANEGRPMAVLHPDDRTPLTWGDKKDPLTITLLGKDSDAFIRDEQAARNKAVALATKGVKFSAAAQDRQVAETLAHCTTGWSGVPQGWIDGSEDESPAEFSFENAVALYLNPGVRWLRDQVDEFIAERRHFLKGKATS